MRACVVEVKHVLFGQTPGMVCAQNKDVIEKLMPHTAHETFTHRIRLGCIEWRVKKRDPAPHRMVEQRTVLAIIIADQKP